MSVEGQVLSSITSSPHEGVWLAVRGGIVVFSLLYFIFSLIVVRQVFLMNETLLTETSPFLKALSIVHAGLSLGIMILFIGFLSG